MEASWYGLGWLWISRRSLESHGILAPSGIVRWNHTTIKNILANDLYAPHTPQEVAKLVDPSVAARLDDNSVYGLWAWNTRKTTRRKVWDQGAGNYKTRYSYESRPREEWLFVPVPDAGIPREVVETARQALKTNSRKPSEAAERFWELSGGILRCGECGHTLRPHTVNKKRGKRLHYYSCRSRYNTGPSRDCSNRKHLRAERVEEQVWDFVYGLLQQPERIKAGLDRLIEEEEHGGAQGDPEREAEFWARRMDEAEAERRGYHRLTVKGHMTEEELGAALAELDEIRETAQRKLEAARAGREALKGLRRDRDTVLGSYAIMAKEALEALVPEERHWIYKLLRLNVYSHPESPLEVKGVFAGVEGGADTGVCRPASSRRVAYKGVVVNQASKRLATDVR